MFGNCAYGVPKLLEQWTTQPSHMSDNLILALILVKRPPKPLYLVGAPELEVYQELHVFGQSNISKMAHTTVDWLQLVMECEMCDTSIVR